MVSGDNCSKQKNQAQINSVVVEEGETFLAVYSEWPERK